MSVTYKCPACGGALEFDSNTQKLKCPMCGQVVDVKEFENEYGDFYQDDETFKDSADFKQDESETMEMKVYHCSSCGAELLSDVYTSALNCSFCGNPTLVEDRLQGQYRPKRIIPFKINRDEAKEVYKKWAKKGLLAPAELKKTSTIEKISGLYVPFWLYDFKARSQMVARGEKVRVTRRGDTEITYHDHFHIFRDVESDFKGVPVDASIKMEDDKMDKMEPFDYGQLQEFSPGYLSGYLSERYNFTADEMQQRANKRVDRYITELTRNTINGYSMVNVVGNKVDSARTKTEYVLLPVWVLNCRYGSKDFTFMLNGQTGKIVANRPISVAKAVVCFITTFMITLLVLMIGGVL